MSTPTLPPLPVLGWASSVGDLYHTEDEANASLYGGPAVPLVSRADATTHAAAIAAERDALHSIVCQCLAALGNGSGASAEASVDFLGNAPNEVGAVIAALRAEVEALKLAEEGAKVAFGHVVQDKRDIAAECARLCGLLASAHKIIMDAARKGEQKHG